MAWPNRPTYSTDGSGNITGLGLGSNTVPLSVQTGIASLGLLPLPGNTTVAGDATNGVIFNTQFPALSSFYGCKLIFANYDTVNTQSWDGVKVAAAPKSLTGGNSSLTWSSFVTVAGSQSFSVPVAVTGAGGQLIPGITVTDFVQVTSTARTDTAGAPFLLRVAAHIVPSANTTNHPNYNGTNYTNLNALGANPGLINGCYNFNGTGATLSQLTSTGASVIAGNGTQQPLAAIFYYTNTHADIWEFGDSRIQGQGTTTTMSGLTQYVAFNSYGKTTQFAGMNFATSGQKTVDTMARLKTVLTAGAASGQLPKYALMMSWSPNDTPINTQSTFDTTWAYVLEMINFCLQKGVQPVVCTGPWATGYTLSYIQTQNARVMALPSSVRKVDLFNLWTPGGTWVSGYNSGDSIHPNDAGESAGANLVLQSVTY